MAKAGRPRSFDKDDALQKAMLVFWEKGYEGTSMADLIQSIGMKAPSLYAAFGNKDAIFKEVVSHYIPIVANGQFEILNSTKDIYEAVQGTLNECVRLFTSDENPHTCLIMTAAINASPEHQEHVEALRSLRKYYKENLKNRFIRALQDRQLETDLEPQYLAEYFMAVIQGMALSAKDGATRLDLVRTTEMAIKVLK